jgi:hypothetical protein
MNKKDLEVIASALQNSKDILEKEANLYEKKTERPNAVRYIRENLIPEIDEAYKIVQECETMLVLSL